MRVAVLTLTRDRVGYTKHTFKKLQTYAGCEYDHFVLDQGSEDSSVAWLSGQNVDLTALNENIGISRGMNLLLDEVVNPDAYDVIVKFDNDCELTQPNMLRDVCQLVIDGGAILSPRILGLRQPPPTMRILRIGEDEILDIPQIGGIFLAAPAWVYNEFRYSESNPTWGMDDVEICQWWRSKGGTCGYVARLEAWHYETTNGQHVRYPDYFARKAAEAA